MSFILYMIPFSVKNHDEAKKTPIELIDIKSLECYTVKENFPAYRDLYGYAAFANVYDVTYDDKPGEVFEERISKPFGVLEKYNYRVLKSFLTEIGEDYVYEMKDKLELKKELLNLLEKEKSLIENTKDYLMQFLKLVEKSIELSKSTIIVEYEV